MNKKLPSMLIRWNAFETVYDRYCTSKDTDPATAMFYVDNLKAACTGRMTRANSLFTPTEAFLLDGMKIDERAWRDFYTQLAYDEGMSLADMLKREGLTDQFYFEGQ